MGWMPHLFHKWREVWSSGKHRYDECEKCGERRVVELHDGGYQPVDLDWLAGAVEERSALGDPNPLELPDFGGDDKLRGEPH